MTDSTLPAGSANHAISGPPLRNTPRSSVAISVPAYFSKTTPRAVRSRTGGLDVRDVEVQHRVRRRPVLRRGVHQHVAAVRDLEPQEAVVADLDPQAEDVLVERAGRLRVVHGEAAHRGAVPQHRMSSRRRRWGRPRPVAEVIGDGQPGPWRARPGCRRMADMRTGHVAIPARSCGRRRSAVGATTMTTEHVRQRCDVRRPDLAAAPDVRRTRGDPARRQRTSYAVGPCQEWVPLSQP